MRKGVKIGFIANALGITTFVVDLLPHPPPAFLFGTKCVGGTVTFVAIGFIANFVIMCIYIIHIILSFFLLANYQISEHYY